MSKLVQMAQLRATITGILTRANAPRSTAEIAGEAKISIRTAGQLLARMANDDLIHFVGKRGKEKMYQAVAEDWQPKPAAAEKPAPRTRTATAKEVELVIGGMLVVVGRNDKTGRIRVVLEELS